MVRNLSVSVPSIAHRSFRNQGKCYSPYLNFRLKSKAHIKGFYQDLSLLTNLTHEDILRLQSVGKDAQDERKAFILRDDEKAAFDHLRSLDGAQVDFVLDNGEQFCPMIQC